MWRESYERYYCYDCDRVFYHPLPEVDGLGGSPSMSPIVVCVDCGSTDTEPMPLEEPDQGHDDFQ